MTIQIDKKPGRKPFRKSGEVAPPCVAPPDPPAPEMVRVRAVRLVVNSKRFGSLTPGQSKEFPEADARDLVRMGLAEFDKSFDSAPETK